MNLHRLLEIRKTIPVSSAIGSIDTRYKMAKFLKSTETDYAFYVEQYQSIMNECACKKEDGTIDSDGQKVAIVPDKIGEFVRRMKELDGTKVDDPTVRFSLSELAPFELSVESLLILDPIIEEKGGTA